MNDPYLITKLDSINHAKRISTIGSAISKTPVPSSFIGLVTSALLCNECWRTDSPIKNHEIRTMRYEERESARLGLASHRRRRALLDSSSKTFAISGCTGGISSWAVFHNT